MKNIMFEPPTSTENNYNDQFSKIYDHIFHIFWGDIPATKNIGASTWTPQAAE